MSHREGANHADALLHAQQAQMQTHGSAVKEARAVEHAPSSVSGLRRSNGKRVSLVPPAPSSSALAPIDSAVAVAVSVPRADASTSAFAPVGTAPATIHEAPRPAQLKKRTLAQLQHGGGISAATRAAMGLGAVGGIGGPASSASSSSTSSFSHHPHHHASHSGGMHTESPGTRERHLTSKRVKGMTPSHEVADALAKVMSLYSPMPPPSASFTKANLHTITSYNNSFGSSSALNSSFDSSLGSTSSAASSLHSSLHSSSVDTSVRSSLNSSLVSSGGTESVFGAFCNLNVPSASLNDRDAAAAADRDVDSLLTPATCDSSAVASSPQDSEAHHRAAGVYGSDEGEAMDVFDEEEEGDLDTDNLAERAHAHTQAQAHAAARARALEELAAEEARDAADCIEEEVQDEEEELACGESLDDDVVPDLNSATAAAAAAQAQSQAQSRMLSDSTACSTPSASADYIEPACTTPLPPPSEPSVSSPGSAAALVQALRFSLPPGAYRSYRPRCALIVSVDSALSEVDPDLENFMWESEQSHQAYPYYVNYQTNLDAGMRPVLLSWMMEVAGEYCLGRETVHLAINYIDRFLTLSPPEHVAASGESAPHRGSIDRTTLQLLGVTALFVAAKVEEIHPPSTEDMADTTAEACSPQAIFEMERVLLHVLDWRLHAQTPFSWLKLFVKKAALELYAEFQERAQELFTPAAVAAAEGAASACLATAASGAPSPSPAHSAHQRFSLLQLSFLSELEGLLSAELFVRMMELLDVLSLDMHSLRFYPSQLAAAVLFLYHAPGSPMFHVVSRATGYEYADLAPALSLLLPFADMPYVGLPGDSARTLMLGLNIPYDELYGRHVSNPHALPALDACAARFAEEVALCHTNVLRSIPPFLAANVYAEMGEAELLVPIRNRHCHRSPDLWNEDPRANHLDPRGVGGPVAAAAVAAAEAAADCGGDPGAIEAAGRLHEQALQASRALEQAERAAAAQSSVPPVAPSSESFLAAAGMPYQRMPADAPVVGGSNAASKAKQVAAAAAAAPTVVMSGSKGGVTFHTHPSGSSAAVAPVSISSVGHTLYTFGEDTQRSSVSISCRSSGSVISATSAADSASALAPRSTVRREWTDSSDDEQ